MQRELKKVLNEIAAHHSRKSNSKIGKSLVNIMEEQPECIQDTVAVVLRQCMDIYYGQYLPLSMEDKYRIIAELRRKCRSIINFRLAPHINDSLRELGWTVSHLTHIYNFIDTLWKSEAYQLQMDSKYLIYKKTGKKFKKKFESGEYKSRLQPQHHGYDDEEMMRYFRIQCACYQLAEYFSKTRLPEGQQFVPDLHRFSRDFYHIIKNFTKWNSDMCKWRWKFTADNGREYTEDETFELVKNYFEIWNVG